MTYRRVIPRDLFNEASLLKCMGRLYLNLDRRGQGHLLVHTDDNEPFRVKQWQDDGSISMMNVVLKLPRHTATLYRPLNSREAYPLWMVSPTPCGDDIQVFKSDGSFTEEMLAFLSRECN